jgi:hypothetical protein
METIIKILPRSILANKLYSEITETYGVAIKAAYNPKLSIDAEKIPSGSTVMKAPVYIKITGEFDSIRRISLDAVNFIR